MNTFFKDETEREVPIIEYIKQNDHFMRLRTSTLGPTLDLSIGKQAMATARAEGVPLVQIKRSQKPNVAPVKSKEKEKAHAQANAKRTTTEPSTEGALKKNLLASVIQAAKKVEIRPSHLSLMATLFSLNCLDLYVFLAG